MTKHSENTEPSNSTKPVLPAVISEEEVEAKMVELGYVDSLNEFEEPTWDEGKLYWARRAFIEAIKWVNSR